MSVRGQRIVAQRGVPVDDARAFYPAIETHMMPSSYVRQTFRIQVMQPVQLEAERTRFPVLYTTDANSAFDVLKGISYGMQGLGPDAARFILVGIGYPEDCPLAGVVLRARDLTFPRYPRFKLEPPPVRGVLLAEEGTKDFHGAEDFRKFIEQELIPFIDARYPTLQAERAYFGHSGGGGFGLFSLFSRSPLFRNYIISSPGLSFHGRSSAGVDYDNHDVLFEYAREFVATVRALDDTKLYMSVGTEEEFEPALAQWRLTSSFYRMAALLRAAQVPGLELTTEALVGETHSTAWPISFMHGVQAVLGTRGRARAIGASA